MLLEEGTFSFSSYCFYDRYNERVDLYSVLMFLLVIHQSLQLEVALTIHLFYSSSFFKPKSYQTRSNVISVIRQVQDIPTNDDASSFSLLPLTDKPRKIQEETF
jgi:hypothetical protein